MEFGNRTVKEFNNFYLMSDNPDDSKPLFLQFKENYDFNQRNLVLRGEKNFISGEPVEFEYQGGNKAMDLIACSVGNYLLSDKVWTEFEKNGIRGCQSYKIVAYDKAQNVLDGYKGLSVVGKCGPIDNELSEKRLMPPRVPWAKNYFSYVGLFFDYKTWDGSDIFLAPGSMFIFVTEKVKSVCLEFGFTNMIFRRITEVENIDAMMKRTD